MRSTSASLVIIVINIIVIIIIIVSSGADMRKTQCTINRRNPACRTTLDENTRYRKRSRKKKQNNPRFRLQYLWSWQYYRVSSSNFCMYQEQSHTKTESSNNEPQKMQNHIWLESHVLVWTTDAYQVKKPTVGECHWKIFWKGMIENQPICGTS